jgi:hypothetical protein
MPSFLHHTFTFGLLSPQHSVDEKFSPSFRPHQALSSRPRNPASPLRTSFIQVFAMETGYANLTDGMEPPFAVCVGERFRFHRSPFADPARVVINKSLSKVHLPPGRS